MSQKSGLFSLLCEYVYARDVFFRGLYPQPKILGVSGRMFTLGCKHSI